MNRHLKRRLLLAAFVGPLCLGAGCVERLLQVRSAPPGARVYLNGEEIGQTPCDHPFSFYGTVDVTVRAPGYLSQRQLVSLSPPWYQFFPMDFVTDVLVPLTIQDLHRVSVELRESSPSEGDPEARRDLDRRAEEMRARLSPEGTAEPPGS
jgi:hypothetical protein